MSVGHAGRGWVATPVSRSLVFRDFEDGSVCYEPSTGETRYLAPLAAFLIQQIGASTAPALTLVDLVDHVLATDPSGLRADEVATRVADVVEELRQAGLLKAIGEVR